jgi:hypothetical protein
LSMMPVLATAGCPRACGVAAAPVLLPTPLHPLRVVGGSRRARRSAAPRSHTAGGELRLQRLEMPAPDAGLRAPASRP